MNKWRIDLFESYINVHRTSLIALNVDKTSDQFKNKHGHAKGNLQKKSFLLEWNGKRQKETFEGSFEHWFPPSLREARKGRAWKDRWGRWGGEGERGGSITHSSNRERHNSVWQVSSIIREKKEQYVFSLLLPTSSPSLPPPFYIVIHSIALNGDRSHAGESRFYRFIIYLFLLLTLTSLDYWKQWGIWNWGRRGGGLVKLNIKKYHSGELVYFYRISNFKIIWIN